MRIRWNFGIKS